MMILLCILGASFTLCCFLIPLAKRLASGWGLLDYPDARRKLHGRPIAVAGGLAVLVSACVVLLAALAVSHTLCDLLAADSVRLLGLFLAALFLCAVGVLDDLECLRGRHKLLGQMVASGIAIAFGVRIDHVELFGWGLELGVFAVPFTLLWLLGAINSLNLLDGMDGMLGCVGFIIALAMAGMAVLTGNWAAACVAAALAGSLLGFLCYNLPPASIFMGDAGSMVTGLVIGALGIQCSLKAPATVVLLASAAVLTIPFLDTAAAVIRRKLTGRSLYASDRGHLHHCLLRRGFSTLQVLVGVSLFGVLAALGGLVSLALSNDLIAACTALTVVAVLVATRLFGYAEFSLVKSRLSQLARSFLQTRGCGQFQQMEVQLHGTANWKDLLDSVTDRAFDLNLQTVRLEVSLPALHEDYYAQWDRFEKELEDSLWRVDLPLVVEGRSAGHLLVTGYPDSEPVWIKVAALNRLIEAFNYDFMPEPFAPPHLARPGWQAVLQEEPQLAADAVGSTLDG